MATLATAIGSYLAIKHIGPERIGDALVRSQPAWVLFVSPNYFSMVDARPIAGRIEVGTIGAGRPSIVIGERFWRRKLNAASLAGLSVRLNNVDVSVTGVLPESFTGPAGLY